MHWDFFKILLASLAVTVGLGFLYWLYRLLIAKFNKNEPNPMPYISLKPLIIDEKMKSVTIMMIVPEELEVQLNILDDEGKVLQKIHDGALSKGNHHFDWDGEQIQKNNLFCQLITKYQKTEKLFHL